MTDNNFYKISFVISTKNRLPFLKILNKHVFSKVTPDEEIVIVDGSSTDGSKEYLQELYNNGLIHQFISEPDINQAHGWNKALLLAKGIFIKKIIDDDVFDLPSIRQCANFMFKNPEIELCISDCLQATLAIPDDISLASRKTQFMKWKNKAIRSFSFSDVYLLIRRSSLSRLGLYDTQFRMLDWEYSLRCSYLNATIAYYVGCMALSVGTPGNITSTTSAKTLRYEGKIGMLKYDYAGDGAEITPYSKLKIFVGKSLNKLFPPPASKNTTIQYDLEVVYDSFYRELERRNQDTPFEVIY
jgi:glycosyltransferase involved in cell wall biosynthesis